MGQSARLDEVSADAAPSVRRLSRARRLLASTSVFIPLAVVACSGGVAGGSVDAAAEGGRGDASDATDMWDGLMPCNGAGCDSGPFISGDAGLCTTDSDCRNGYVCIYRTEPACGATIGQCLSPNTMDCTGGRVACDCTGATFEIPCWYDTHESPRPITYFGPCEAGADSGGGDASPE
jgi:hypothetical protein